MSNEGRPEFEALEVLEEVVARLTDELRAWRQRALRAESARSELGAEHDVVAVRERILELEAENTGVSGRLEATRARVSDLLGRLRFLEEQVTMEEQSR